MLRLALWLLLTSLVLMAIGWLSIAHAVFEVIRVASIGSLSLAFLLLLIEYVLTPEPPQSPQSTSPWPEN